MGPLVNKINAKEEETAVKRGTVGKLKTEVRRRVPDPKVIRNNYYVNKAKQVNKIVLKNRTAAPISIESHANDVYINYSPAVFKEAVMVVSDSMKENTTFESDKMTIKVTKVMPSLDLKGTKTIDLITMEVQSKRKKKIQLSCNCMFIILTRL